MGRDGSSSDGLYQKKGNPVWYGWYRDPGTGERVQFCTGTKDRRAARLFRAKRERDAYEAYAAGRPAPHVAAQHSLRDALDYLLTSGANNVAPATLECYATKGGHVLRLLGDEDVNALL